MQFSGGYKYPSGKICRLLSFLTFCITIFVFYHKNIAPSEAVSLFLNLEGTVLLASSFTPVGLSSPPQGFIQKIKWFFQQQYGTPLEYNQPMFYAGLTFLFLATLVSAIR